MLQVRLELTTSALLNSYCFISTARWPIAPLEHFSLSTRPIYQAIIGHKRNVPNNCLIVSGNEGRIYMQHSTLLYRDEWSIQWWLVPLENHGSWAAEGCCRKTLILGSGRKTPSPDERLFARSLGDWRRPIMRNKRLYKRSSPTMSLTMGPCKKTLSEACLSCINC